jgi:hypothetical protein
MNTHRLPVAALIVLLAGGVARAQQPAPADPAAQAKDHYDKAVRLYEVGKYDAAITEFQSAYELTGEPVLIFNIAQAHKQRGDYREAVKFYKRYLGKVPNAKNKAEVEKKIADLETEIAKGTAPTPPTGTGTGTTGTGTGTTGTGTGTTGTGTGTGTTGTGTGTTGTGTTEPPDGPGTDGTGTGTGTGDVSLGGGIEREPKPIRLFVGGGIMMSSVSTTFPGGIDPPAVLGTGLLGGSYGIPLGAMTLDVGGYGTIRLIPYGEDPQHFTQIWALTAFGSIRYPVIPQLDVRGELGLGLGAWSGLDTGNPFTGGGTTMATAAVGTFVWRIGAGADYYITDNIFIALNLAFGQSRPLDSAVSDKTSAISHFDVLALAGYAL